MKKTTLEKLVEIFKKQNVIISQEQAIEIDALLRLLADTVVENYLRGLEEKKLKSRQEKIG